MSNQLAYNKIYQQPTLTGVGRPIGERTLARVEKVVYGPLNNDGSSDPVYATKGRWSTVGGVVYTIVYGAQNLPEELQDNNIAKPYYSNINYYPVRGEIVELIVGPSYKLNDSGLATDLYYLTPFNLWNNVHHNSFPNFYNLALHNQQQQTSLSDITNGVSTNADAPSQPPYKLGDTFVEQLNVKNLQAFEGDMILQGRWGQSIRFGSTVTDSITKNPWSSGEAAKNGDPILIIRNGQGKQSSIFGPIDPYVPTTEDINTDAASIYLCSGQVVRIKDIEDNHVPKLKTFLIKRLNEEDTQNTNRPAVSTDFTSAASQSSRELAAAQASAATSANQIGNATDKLNVEGDVSVANNNYTVYLRALNQDKQIVTTVSKSGLSLDLAYVNAVTEMRRQNQGYILIIVPKDKLNKV